MRERGSGGQVITRGIFVALWAQRQIKLLYMEDIRGSLVGLQILKPTKTF